MIFIEAPTSESEMRRVARAADAPSFANMVEGGKTPIRDAATLQQIGFGLSYSTSQLLRAPGRIPAEVAFRHFETLSVSGGPAPKAIQDQITVRVFFR